MDGCRFLSGSGYTDTVLKTQSLPPPCWLANLACINFCLDLQRPVCPLLIFDLNFDLYGISTGDVLDALLYDKAKMTFLDTNDQF